MLCKIIASSLLSATVLVASAEDKVTLSSGAVHSGTVTRVDATTLTIRLATGEVGFPRKDIAKVEIQKPAELDAALKANETKKYAEAIPVLKAVTEKYLNLDLLWLQQAYAILGDSYVATNQWPAAVDTFKKLLQVYPQTPYAVRAKVGLAQGLMSEKKYDEAIKMIETAVDPLRKELAISPTENLLMGVAMNTLGDCYQAKGGSDNLEKALDCYLSTVVLYYRDEQAVRQAQEKAEEVKKKLKSSV